MIILWKDSGCVDAFDTMTCDKITRKHNVIYAFALDHQGDPVCFSSAAFQTEDEAEKVHKMIAEIWSDDRVLDVQEFLENEP